VYVTVHSCIQIDYIQMCAKQPEIQNDLPIIIQVKLTSYVFNKIAAKMSGYVLNVAYLHTLYIANNCVVVWINKCFFFYLIFLIQSNTTIRNCLNHTCTCIMPEGKSKMLAIVGVTIKGINTLRYFPI